MVLLLVIVVIGLVGLGVGAFQLFNSEVVLEGYATRSPDREPFRFEGNETHEDPVNREFGIVAPQIDVNAPVFANVDGSNEKNYLPNVLRGVAHYQHKKLDTVTVDGAVPGQVGNIFLFGHSQIPGGSLENYQGVFNNLEELIVGDIVKIYYQGEEYRYEIKSGQVVTPDAVELLEHTETETLTLMSCWPLGLDWKRYVVRAERVS